VPSAAGDDGVTSFTITVRRLRVALAACGVALSAGRALGQEGMRVPTTDASPPTVEAVRQTYRLHVGPLYVDPRLLLKELGVDSNVFYEEHDPRSDFTFTLTPEADIALPVAHRAMLASTLSVDGVYYQTYASERSLDPMGTVKGELYAGRVTLFAYDSYVDTRQRPNYEIDLRSRHVNNDFIGGVRLHLTQKFSLEGAGIHAQTRYDGEAVYYNQSLKENLDRDTTGYTVTARQRLTPLTTVLVRYENLQDRFVYRPERDANSFSLRPGVEFKPRALISGRAIVGYRRFEPLSPLIKPYSGLVGQVALSYTLKGATTFGVQYDRDVVYSFNATTPYYIDNSPQIMLRRQIVGQFDVIGRAARHTYDYRGIDIGSISSSDPTQTTSMYDVNVGYRLKRDLRIGVGVNNSRRDASAPLPAYSALRVKATVSYGVLQ
jgi:hypothetical protein